MKRILLIWGVTLAMVSAAHTELPDFDALWDYNDPAGTETRMRELLPAAQASAKQAYHAELLTQIARTHGLRGEFDSAHALLDRVWGMLAEVGHRPRVRYLLERGRCFNSGGKKEEATPLFLEAWELAQQQGFDFFAVDAAHMMAIVAPTAEQVAWNLKAASLAESSSDPLARNWQGSLFNNMGWTYFDQKDYSAALAMFEKALTFRLEQKKPREIRIARWCVAKAFRCLERTEEALVIQRDLLAELENAGEEQDGYVLEELAECLLILGREAEARPHFADAHRLLAQDSWLAKHEPERLARLKRLAAKP